MCNKLKTNKKKPQNILFLPAFSPLGVVVRGGGWSGEEGGANGLGRAPWRTYEVDD